MEQKDKQLLFKDLCARLPYGVIVYYGYNAFDIHNGNHVKYGSKCILKCYLLDVFMSPRQNEEGEYIKPYLRSMSSMTEEEKKEYYETMDKYTHRIYPDSFDFSVHTEYSWTADTLDWLNSHHFDYRGLIEKGLAIEAPNGMYN